MCDWLRRLLDSALIVALAAAWVADPVPNTLGEAFVSADRALLPTDRASFSAAPEQEVVAQAHFGLGLYIRNQWLRAGRLSIPRLLQAQSRDDACVIVLTPYGRPLHGRPLKVGEQMACYRRW